MAIGQHVVCLCCIRPACMLSLLGGQGFICLEMLAHPVRASFWECPDLSRGTFEKAC